MQLPVTLKALKFVAQGQSLATAKQIVRDRRLAKSLAVAGLDKTVFAAKAKETAKPVDAWDEKLSAQVAFYKKQGLTKLNPQLASKSYIEACRKLGLDPVWDKPPVGFNGDLTFVYYEPPLHLTKEQIFAKPPLPVGIADDTFFDALRLQRKTVRFADVIAEAHAMTPPTAKKKVRFADQVPSCPTIFRGGLAFAAKAPVSVEELANKLGKKEGKKADR